MIKQHRPSDFISVAKAQQQKYQKCTVVVKGFSAFSVLNQVKLYQTLGLFENNVNAALEIIEKNS